MDVLGGQQSRVLRGGLHIAHDVYGKDQGNTRPAARRARRSSAGHHGRADSEIGLVGGKQYHVGGYRIAGIYAPSSFGWIRYETPAEAQGMDRSMRGRIEVG